MQIINENKSLNGMLTLINKNNTNFIKKCCEYINNKCIMHHVISKYKLITISVHKPPFKKIDITNDALRIKKICKMHRYIKTLLDFAKFIDWSF